MYSFSQSGVAVNTSGASANVSAMLDVSSTTAGRVSAENGRQHKKIRSVRPQPGYCFFKQMHRRLLLLYRAAYGTQLGTTTIGQNANHCIWNRCIDQDRRADILCAYSRSDYFISIPANGTYYVYIATDGGFQTQSALADGFSACDIALFIDGSAVSNGAAKD
jgi:hypothetical protein